MNERVTDIVERLEGPLVLYAQRILGDLEAARDCVQETFLRFCRQPPDAEGSGMDAWLYRVCRSRALDALRKEGRMRALETEDAGTDPAPGPCAVAEQSDEAGRVRHAMAVLSRNQQEVLQLKFRHGLSYAEISRVAELGTGNVGFLISTALKTLRHTLGRPEGMTS